MRIVPGSLSRRLRNHQRCLVDFDRFKSCPVAISPFSVSLSTQLSVIAKMPREKRTRDSNEGDNAQVDSGASTSAHDSVASGRPKREPSKPASKVETNDVKAQPRDATLPLTYEMRLWKKNPFALIAGVDEAGRGPLCGPVVASCCIMMPPPLWPALYAAAGVPLPSDIDASTLTTGPWRAPVEGVADSKGVQEEDRERIFPRLVADPRLVFGTSVVDHATIDRVNILRATMVAMDVACARALARARSVLAPTTHGKGAKSATGSAAAVPVSNPVQDGAKVDITSAAWLAPFSSAADSDVDEEGEGTKGAGSGAGAQPAGTAQGMDAFLRLHTVLIDGNKCPPGLIMACEGPPEPAAVVQAKKAALSSDASTAAAKRGGRGGKKSSGPAKPKPQPVVEDDAYAATVQAIGRAGMALPVDADITGTGTGTGAGASAGAGAGAAGQKTVADVLTLASVDAGANAAHVTFHTSESIASSIGKVFTVEPVIGGDARVYCIAAASLCAKVTRDRLMRQAAVAWPGYGLELHKGYGTASHMSAIHAKGPCPIHRLSYAPLKDMYPQAAAKAKGVAHEEG